MWLSLVERCVRDAKAAGSNPVTSTKNRSNRPNIEKSVFGRFFMFCF